MSETKTTEAQVEPVPLWPDCYSSQPYTCWNCGQRALGKIAGSSTRYMCSCGCGWSVRFGVVPEVERGQFEFREKDLARKSRLSLVDFTKPGALSSPA